MNIVILSVHKSTNSTPLTHIKESKQELGFKNILIQLVSPVLPMLVHLMHSLGLRFLKKINKNKKYIKVIFLKFGNVITS